MLAACCDFCSLQDTLTAVACSISAAYSQCICKPFPQGGTYTDTCWTAIAAQQQLDANTWSQTNGKQCAASGAGAANATEVPAGPAGGPQPGG